MNTALTFLQQNRERLALDQYGITGRMSALVVTPRFRASRHVVFLVFSGGGPEPVLVAKVPRLAAHCDGIRREAANLQAAQGLRVGGFDSIPRVVACEPFRGGFLLVETALAGQPMGPAMVRRHLADCCDAVIDWLGDLQQPGDGATAEDDDWFVRLIERPLCQFEERFPVSATEARLLDRTWEAVSPLRAADLPLVFEHGDLSHPNLIVLRGGGVGVIDWELADPHGLPAQDLFFFLTYAAFAAGKARAVGRHLPAFHAAFFGRRAWVHPYVLAYAHRLQLPPELLTPLFVACWARRVTGLLDRLSETEPAAEPLSADTAAWIRANRYYALWQHTLAHLDELKWHHQSLTY